MKKLTSLTPEQTNRMASFAQEWAPIPGHESYEASTSGDIRSWLPANGLPAPRVLKQGIRPDGRFQVTLHDVKPPKSHKVHVLVAATFLGPRPEGHHVRHLNGDHSQSGITG